MLQQRSTLQTPENPEGKKNTQRLLQAQVSASYTWNGLEMKQLYFNIYFLKFYGQQSAPATSPLKQTD